MIRFWGLTRWLDRLRLVIGAIIGLAVIGWTIDSFVQVLWVILLSTVVNLLIYGFISYASQRWYANRWKQFYQQPNAKAMRAFQQHLAFSDRSEINQWPRVVAACDLAFSYTVSGWFDHARNVLESARLENQSRLEKNDLMRYRIVLQEANLDLLATGGNQAAMFAELFADLAQKVYLSHQEAVERQVRFFTLVHQLHTLDWEIALASLQAESGAESRHRYLTRMYVLYRFYQKNDNETEAKRIQTAYFDEAAELVTTYSNIEEPPLPAPNSPPVQRYSPKTQRRLTIALIGIVSFILLIRPLIPVWNSSLLAGVVPLIVLGLGSIGLLRRIEKHKLLSILIFVLFTIVYSIIQAF
jgi:hypothetical protein